MKLSALNSAIRSLKGPPTVDMRFAHHGDGSMVELSGLEVTKQSALAALKARFGEVRATETGLTLVGNRLCHETAAHLVAGQPAAPAAEEPDVEDLFG